MPLIFSQVSRIRVDALQTIDDLFFPQWHGAHEPMSKK